MKGPLQPSDGVAPTGGPTTFMLNMAERWVITPICALIVAAVGMGWMQSALTSDRVIGALVVLVAVVGACWLMLRVRISLYPDRILISNIRSVNIPYSEITDLRIGYEGLRVQTSKRSYTALAVQKPNISKILGRRTRADIVADEIRARIAAAR